MSSQVKHTHSHQDTEVVRLNISDTRIKVIIFRTSL